MLESIRSCSLLLWVLFTLSFRQRRLGPEAWALAWCLLAECLALLATRQRGLYVRWREAFELLALLGQNATVWFLGFRCSAVGTLPARHDGNCPLLLLLVLLIAGPLWACIYHCDCRTVLPWSCLALPLAVPGPLAGAPSYCRMLVQVPDSCRPMGALFRAIDAVHGSTNRIFSEAEAEAYPPMRQCMAINLYLWILLGIAVPLAATYTREWHARRVVETCQLRQQAHAQQHGLRQQQAGPAGARWDEMHEGSGQQMQGVRQQPAAAAAERLARLQDVEPRLPLSGWWVLDVYVASMLLWWAVTALAPAL